MRTIIEAGIGRWRSAVIDQDGFPARLTFHDSNTVSPIGSIVDARVRQVNARLDMVFLDLGPLGEGVMNRRRARQRVKGAVKRLSDCAHEGECLRVQVLSDPGVLETGKALSVTPRARLVGRYVVAECLSARDGNSTGKLSLSNDLPPKRARALDAALSPLTAQAGVNLIVRSRAASVDDAFVIMEAERLTKPLSAPLETGTLYSPALIDLALTAVEDGDVPVQFADRASLTQARTVTADRYPDLSARLDIHPAGMAAFEEDGVEDALQEALADRIVLPSGGWLSIHETPALTAIDVNMGAALAAHGPQEAIRRVNLEAALAIAHHLDFQDIGGLIVTDFIDMRAKDAVADLTATLDAALGEHKTPVERTGLSRFGLMELRRARSGLSLRQRLLTRPATPGGPNAAAQALSLLQQAQRLGRQAQPGTLTMAAPEAVTAWLDARPELIRALEQDSLRQVVVKTADTVSVTIQETGRTGTVTA
ncbi:Rne/Rng family ribonuclease [Eilatimonas milleporae]|uniref:Rne/Rng family ribonuclease n=2 Tax=Eilatimonas milleporae TaxID=911205 RepID=A0A3M0BZF8_9PROT|nr:Rne/Rng family ribonuclease [Eilatimonas milleporae]